YKLGVKAMIFMPDGTPSAKISATKGYGAEVKIIGQSFQEAYTASLEYRKLSGATYIHPFDDFDIMAGQRTTGLELIEEIPKLDQNIDSDRGGVLKKE